jgi:hypothetical protein
MDQNLCFEYQQLMSRYNITDKQHRQLELKKNDSQYRQQQIKKEKISKEIKNNNLKVEEMPTMPMPTQHHHRLNLSNLFKNIKPAPVAAPVAAPVVETVAAPVVEAAMKNKILFKALQQLMFKK